MSKVTIHGLESLELERTAEYPSSLTLTAKATDGTEVVFHVGRYFDDLTEIRATLESVLEDAGRILDEWEDEPDFETDGVVTFGNGRYYVQLEGTFQHTGYPTQDIAEYELARTMAEAGYFPNVWFQNDRGNTHSIGDSVRKYHDEGGDKLLPLAGMQYEDGADVLIRFDAPGSNEPGDLLSGHVVKDYGILGIVYRYSGDDEDHFTEDRSVVVWDDSDAT